MHAVKYWLYSCFCGCEALPGRGTSVLLVLMLLSSCISFTSSLALVCAGGLVAGPTRNQLRTKYSLPQRPDCLAGSGDANSDCIVRRLPPGHCYCQSCYPCCCSHARHPLDAHAPHALTLPSSQVHTVPCVACFAHCQEYGELKARGVLGEALHACGSKLLSTAHVLRAQAKPLQIAATNYCQARGVTAEAPIAPAEFSWAPMPAGVNAAPATPAMPAATVEAPKQEAAPEK